MTMWGFALVLWGDGEGEVVDGADGDGGAGGERWGVGREGGLPDFAADFYLAGGVRDRGQVEMRGFFAALRMTSKSTSRG